MSSTPRWGPIAAAAWGAFAFATPFAASGSAGAALVAGFAALVAVAPTGLWLDDALASREARQRIRTAAFAFVVADDASPRELLAVARSEIDAARGHRTRVVAHEIERWAVELDAPVGSDLTAILARALRTPGR